MMSPMVIDSGSGTIKSGLSGDSSPQFNIPSYVGRPKYKAVIASAYQKDIVSGEQLLEMAGLLALSHPIEHGQITNYDDMTTVWETVYRQSSVDKTQHDLLLTEAPLTAQSQKEKTAEIFLEAFQVPRYFAANSGVMALYASGETTGIVLTSGHGVSHCVSVCQGYSLTHAQTRIDLAGHDVTHYLATQFNKQGYSFHTSIVNKVKEHRCLLLDSRKTFMEHQQNNVSIGGDPYILPDGKVLDIQKEKYKSPEILFSPQEIGLECMTIPELLVSSLNDCDLDLRRTLINKIVLAGGTTMIQGFPERLLSELKEKVSSELQIKMTAPQNRHLTTWQGASIFANLQSFNEMWITKADYEEQGSRILLKNAF